MKSRLQNNQSKMDWSCGSSGRTSALQTQSPEFKPYEGLKDRLQKVPKDDKWSRRHFSFLGNSHLHLKGISAIRQCKKAIKPHSLPWPTGPPVSRSPAFSNMQSFSSLLYK
jgi:hypothetical protein